MTRCKFLQLMLLVVFFVFCFFKWRTQGYIFYSFWSADNTLLRILTMANISALCPILHCAFNWKLQIMPWLFLLKICFINDSVIYNIELNFESRSTFKRIELQLTTIITFNILSLLSLQFPPHVFPWKFMQ